MSRRTPFVATVVALPLALGGCGIGSSIAGIHPAPSESTGGASITPETARDVSARVLEDAAAVRKAGGKASAAERKDVFSGPALRAAEAAARSKDKQHHAGGSTQDLEVLAVSRGTEWPRAVLATSRDEGTQFLHVLLADAADSPYTLFADVPMAAGASVPALSSVPEGSTVTVAKEPAEEVGTAIKAWAKGVTYPAPKKQPTQVSFADAFSTALQKNAKAKDEDLDKLATYRQRQSIVDATTVDFELAGGGHLTFLPMTRTDTITAGKKLKELKIRDKPIRNLLDASTVEDSLSIRHAETVALVTPEKGKAKVVGVSDVLARVAGH